jgi:hypothetical protein
MENINDFIDKSPYSYVLMGFLSGLLFSGISWGIVYVILFLILSEILYFGYLSANDYMWDFDLRATVLLAALLGYLTGAFFHDMDDHYESWCKFKKDYDGWVKELS